MLDKFWLISSVEQLQGQGCAVQVLGGSGCCSGGPGGADAACVCVHEIVLNKALAAGWVAPIRWA